MAKQHLLTELAIKNAKPKAKAYRLRDGSGLFLWVPASGVASWQFRYKLGGHAQTLTLGKLASMDVKEARKRAQDARKRVADGAHLTVAKNVAKAKLAAASKALFAKVAADWVDDEAQRKKWTADYRGEVEASLRNHLHKLDGLPVAEITAAICSPVLRKADKTAPDMARKVRQRLRGIFDYAVEHGAMAFNPIPAARSGVKIERKHLPAVLTHEGIGEILRAADRTDAGRGVKRAHLLCAFTVQRIGEIVAAEWSEFDFGAGTWAIPRTRMKRKDPERGPHLVPLPPGLRAMLVEWRRADGDDGVWVCPSPRGDTPVTREAIEKFYRNTLDLAGKHGAHGWRSVFSTWSYEAGRDGAVIEAQLDHTIGSKVQAAYDRLQRLDLRRELMTWHESQLIAARDGAQVVVLQRHA